MMMAERWSEIGDLVNILKLKSDFTPSGPGGLSLVSSIGFSLFLVLPWINSPGLNLEFLFVDAANHLFSQESHHKLDNYFFNQANPLGTAFLARLSQELLPFLSSLTAARLQSVLGLLLVVVSGWWGFRGSRGSNRVFSFWVGVVTLNPLVIVTSTRVSADLLPSALVFAAFVIADNACRKPSLIGMAAVPSLLIVGATLKYNAIYFLGSLVPLSISKRQSQCGVTSRQRLTSLASGVFLGSAILTILLVWQALAYGVVFLDSDLRMRHGLQLGTPVENIARATKYIAYLSLLLIPITVLYLPDLLKKRTLLYLTALVVPPLFLLANSKDPTGGELDFGAFIGRVPLVGSALLLVGCLFAPSMLLTLRYQTAHGRKLNLIAFTAFPLLVMAVARPAQRYLIPLVLILSYSILSTTSVTRLKYRLTVPLLLLLFLVHKHCWGIKMQRHWLQIGWRSG